MGIDIGKNMREAGHPDAPKDKPGPGERDESGRVSQKQGSKRQVPQKQVFKKAGVTFRELQRKNRRRSIVLALVMILVFGALGASIGAVWGSWMLGLGIGVVIAGVQFGFARATGSALVMKAVGARPLGEREDPQLRNVIEEMAIAAGLPKPAIYLVEEDSPNAFATGFKPEDSAIAITTALRDRLDRAELQAVLGHEMAHIKNGDSGYMVLMSVLVGSIVMLSDMVIYRRRGIHMMGRSRQSSKVAAPLLILALVLAILAPILSRILQAAVSREREFLADATAVELTRQPDALVSALKKLTLDPAKFEAANRATQHLFIVNPMKAQRFGGGMFASHPPLEKRIERIRALYL
jgi:heat shock protein HtpX